MNVKIKVRKVYHKVVEVDIEIPLMEDYNVSDYLITNEHLWDKKVEDAMDKKDVDFGLGMDTDKGWNEPNAAIEQRYEVVKYYGGHI